MSFTNLYLTCSKLDSNSTLLPLPPPVPTEPAAPGVTTISAPLAYAAPMRSEAESALVPAKDTRPAKRKEKAPAKRKEKAEPRNLPVRPRQQDVKALRPNKIKFSDRDPAMELAISEIAGHLTFTQSTVTAWYYLPEVRWAAACRTTTSAAGCPGTYSLGDHITGLLLARDRLIPPRWWRISGPRIDMRRPRRAGRRGFARRSGSRRCSRSAARA